MIAEGNFVNNLQNLVPTIESSMFLTNYYENRGELDKAIQECAKILTVEPNNEHALQKLQSLSLKKVQSPTTMR